MMNTYIESQMDLPGRKIKNLRSDSITLSNEIKISSIKGDHQMN